MRSGILRVPRRAVVLAMIATAEPDGRARGRKGPAAARGRGRRISTRAGRRLSTQPAMRSISASEPTTTQPTLSPDALKLIAEHKEWGANATVCTALVRNPKTPLPLALRLLDRVPIADVRAIAKGGARDALVHAARKRVAG